MIRLFDAPILDAVERASHAVTRWTGMSLHWQYHRANDGELVLGLAVAALRSVEGRGALGVDVALALLVYASFRGNPNMRESAIAARLAAGVRNPARIDRWFMMIRIVACVIVALIYALRAITWSWSAWQVFDVPQSALVLAVIYLGCCDGLPPCSGKVREWWLARRTVLRPVSVDT